ncbi:hypothetical protein A2U01_0112875, partial [Trifolium medium]|nr:hypothetical protein [Trifolium medium]
ESERDFNEDFFTVFKDDTSSTSLGI